MDWTKIFGGKDVGRKVGLPYVIHFHAMPSILRALFENVNWNQISIGSNHQLLYSVMIQSDTTDCSFYIA